MFHVYIVNLNDILFKLVYNDVLYSTFLLLYSLYVWLAGEV